MRKITGLLMLAGIVGAILYLITSSIELVLYGLATAAIVIAVFVLIMYALYLIDPEGGKD